MAGSLGLTIQTTTYILSAYIGLENMSCVMFIGGSFWGGDGDDDADMVNMGIDTYV